MGPARVKARHDLQDQLNLQLSTSSAAAVERHKQYMAMLTDAAKQYQHSYKYT